MGRRAGSREKRKIERMVNMAEKKAAVLLADGCEEGEALFVIDILRRAGVACDGVSITGGTVTGSHGIRFLADLEIGQADKGSYDMIVLPGGLPGADHLRDSREVVAWVRTFAENPEKYVAAICAAPQVLAEAGVVKGRRVTSYPGEKYRALLADAEYVDDNRQTQEMVVVDGNLITSRGPATTLPFAYKLVELLGGDAEALREKMCYNALKAVLR